MIRVLVTGAGGQVGAEVARVLAGRAELVMHDRASLDLADAAQVAARIREARVQLIVNAAAYTAVDRAEAEEPLARAVNAIAPGVIADEAKRAGALLVHYSTDYVFDGAKAAPYVEADATNPLNAYGRTKLEGERNIAQSGCAHLILRTSWVYGPQRKELPAHDAAARRDARRAARGRRPARRADLEPRARARLSRLLAGDDPPRPITPADLERLAQASGLYHATASGETTWYGFATAIFEAARSAGLATRSPRVVPIASRDYPTPARRPANSVLSSAKLERTFGVRLEDWRAGLAETLSALRR